MGESETARGIISWGSRTVAGYYVTAAGGRYARVHRLVARAFLGPPPSALHCDVNHKDLDRGNNHVSNLAYATRSENILHAWRTNPDRKSVQNKADKEAPGLRRLAHVSIGILRISRARVASFEYFKVLSWLAKSHWQLRVPACPPRS